MALDLYSGGEDTTGQFSHNRVTQALKRIEQFELIVQLGIFRMEELIEAWTAYEQHMIPRKS